MCVIFLGFRRWQKKKKLIAYLFAPKPLARTHLVWAHKYLDKDNPLIDSADRAAIASDTPGDPWACAPARLSHCGCPAAAGDRRD